MSTKNKLKTVRFTQQDKELIAKLKEYTGATSDNEVIRMSLRSACRELGIPTQAPNKDSLISPA